MGGKFTLLPSGIRILTPAQVRRPVDVTGDNMWVISAPCVANWVLSQVASIGKLILDRFPSRLSSIGIARKQLLTFYHTQNLQFLELVRLAHPSVGTSHLVLW